MFTPLQPEGMPTPVVPLSSGVRAGNLVFVSGQVATQPDGSVYIGEFADEVEKTMDNVEAILAAGGAAMADVVKVNAWIANPLLFKEFNEVYARRFPGTPPARTTVAVAFGHPDVRVEVDAIAYVED